VRGTHFFQPLESEQEKACEKIYQINQL